MPPLAALRSGQVNGHEPHIRSLDGLRGVSALLVLFHHILLTQPNFANFEWHDTTTRPHSFFQWIMFETPLRVLWAGQERAILFFVLSGLVLSLPWLHGHPRPYKRFLLSRFCRLYPPYIIVMVIAAIGAFFIGGKPIPAAGIWFNQLGWSLPLSWAAVPSVLFLQNGPSSNWLDESVWSLIWEARVVLIFPFLILPVIRWKNTGIAVVLMSLVAIHPIITIILPRHLANSLNDIGTALLYPEFFILGVAIALNQDAIRRWLSRWRGMAGLTTLALGLMMFWIHWPMQNSRADGIAATLIVAAALGCPSLANVLKAKILLWLGRLSYSLYLIHVPIILAVIIMFHGKVPPLACIIVAFFSIGAAELFRLTVEAPSVRLTSRLAIPTRSIALQHYTKTQETVDG